MRSAELIDRTQSRNAVFAKASVLFSILLKVLALLDRGERKVALLLFVLMVGVGLIEVIGVASILPLIAVLSNPRLIYSNESLHLAYTTLGFDSVNAFLFFLSFTVFMITIFRALSTVLLNYATLRFAHRRISKWSGKLFADYLRRPYVWFITQHSAELAKSILFEADQVVQGCLLPALSLTSQIVVSVFILGLILVVEPVVTGIVTAIIGSVYLVIYIMVRKRLVQFGDDRVKSHANRFLLAQETIGGIKEVKVSGSELTYENRFKAASEVLADRTQKLQFIREVPKNILEVLAIGGILLFILALLAKESSDFASIMPIIGLYAFAGMRLMPSINRIFQDFAYLKSYEGLLDKFSRDLLAVYEQPIRVVEPFRFEREIELSNVTFSFPPSARGSLSVAHLVIPAGAIIGVVGPTGAGKSTLIDIILGLLEPQTGSVRIDGEKLDTKNTGRWQTSLGYVPQQIFLFDDSIAANIAIGVPRDEIDLYAVELAARAACLHDFIVSELHDGYSTEIGDKGIRLSGGQRQRIGIARALYRRPAFVVLDEATSALDSQTEKAVIRGLGHVTSVKTALHVTHRLSTARVCDQIIFLEHGSVSAVGSYDDLVRTNVSFRDFASAALSEEPSPSGASSAP